MTNDAVYSNEITPRLIDQLVCGSLQGEAYRQAIRALDANPAKWRDCALAFLQEQAIEQELKQLALTDVDWRSVDQPERTSLSNPVLMQAGLTNSVASQPRYLSGFAIRLGSLAAMLLLGCGIGWMLSARNEPAPLSHDSLIAANQPAPENTSALVAENPAESTRFTSSSTGGEEFFRNNNPLVGNLSSQMVPIDQEIPAALRELERRGRVRIESTSALMPIRHDNGTSVLVPVQQFQIVPVVHVY